MADSGKLYFLRDRGRRPAARSARKRAEGAGGAEAQPHRPSEQESLWLARLLFAEAGYLVLQWIAVAVGLVGLPELGESRVWLFALLPCDLLVATVAALAAWDLLRRSGVRDLYLAVAAGGLVTLGVLRLTHGIASGFVRDLSPGERMQITLTGIGLYVGLWAASHAFRARRAGD